MKPVMSDAEYSDYWRERANTNQAALNRRRECTATIGERAMATAIGIAVVFSLVSLGVCCLALTWSMLTNR